METVTIETVKKVSQITVNNLINYLRLSEDDVDDYDKGFLESLNIIAQEYIKKMTSVTDLDLYPEFVVAVYVLVEDMYDNRSMNVDKAGENKVVEVILGLNDFNFL